MSDLATLPTVDQVEAEALEQRLEYAAAMLAAEVDHGETAEHRWDTYRAIIDRSLLVQWREVLAGLDAKDRIACTVPLGGGDQEITGVVIWGTVPNPRTRAGSCLVRHGDEHLELDAEISVTVGRYVFVRDHDHADDADFAWWLRQVRDDEARSVRLTVVTW